MHMLLRRCFPKRRDGVQCQEKMSPNATGWPVAMCCRAYGSFWSRLGAVALWGASGCKLLTELPETQSVARNLSRYLAEAVDMEANGHAWWHMLNGMLWLSSSARLIGIAGHRASIPGPWIPPRCQAIQKKLPASNGTVASIFTHLT